MIASLACYDLPELRPAVEAWWAGIRKALFSLEERSAPERLHWPDDVEAHWSQPGFYLTQTCGYPLVTVLRGKLRPVATQAIEVDLGQPEPTHHYTVGQNGRESHRQYHLHKMDGQYDHRPSNMYLPEHGRETRYACKAGSNPFVRSRHYPNLGQRHHPQHAQSNHLSWQPPIHRSENNLSYRQTARNR